MALYGHPDPGAEWEHHCDESLRKTGFVNVGDGACPPCCFHKELGLLLSVCVDDFKLAGPTSTMEEG